MTVTAIRLLTALIPLRGVRRRMRRRMMERARAARFERELPRIRARYAELERKFRGRLARGERVKVVFLVCDASMFSGESVFVRMWDDPRFDCSIAVAPRVTRGEAFLRDTLAKTVKTLAARYGASVRALYDPETGRAEDIDADLVFSTVLYEDQTLPNYTTERLSERALVAILYYGYGGLFVSNEKKTPYLPNIVFAWRYFVSNEETRRMNVEKNPLLAANIVVSGYAKMDRFEVERVRVEAERKGASRRKKIVISPHHTIDKAADGLALSTFLEHAELFLRLPEMFPEIDFVFRPHPLLFPRLATGKWWGEERTAEYRARLEAFPNVEFQQGGDYFRTFAESDAMIHDCGSFLAEYFYTGKPQCYLLEGERTVDEQFLPVSRRLLAFTERAYSDADIVAFIRRVGAGEDPRRAEREAFAAREVCVNHPHATEAVIAGILKDAI